MDPKRKAVLDRIEWLDQRIRIARAYLESGKHADWSGFRPLFDRKFRNGKELPPHKDWVRNWFLPNKEKALGRAEKILERLGRAKGVKRRGKGDAHRGSHCHGVGRS